MHDVSLEIRPGETVAFVGSSGSGKSTLLNLVLGFVRPTAGTILLDGADMQDLDLRTVRRFVSVVPQESVLFEGSIRDNIAYGLPELGDEAIHEALRDANALDVVASQPHGWDTVVGERGARLSGGQRQRLAIARALVRNPRILLLDEATSALDPESEQLVKEALSRLMRGRTTLVVAHRLSTIRSADRIVVLEGGRIVEVGAHDELLRRGGPLRAAARDPERRGGGRMSTTARTARRPAPGEIYRDPVYDGATDPTVVRHPDGGWWMFYTQRRALHARSRAGGRVGARQPHRRRAQRRRRRMGVRRHAGALGRRASRCATGAPPTVVGETHWAPEVIHDGARWRMYLTEIDGVPERWDGHDRRIVEYVSDDLAHWHRRGPLPLGSDRVIDAAVARCPDGDVAALVQGRGGRSR